MATKHIYTRGKIFHHTKQSAQVIGSQCKSVGIPYKIVKTTKGFRVDKDWRTI